MDSVYLIINIAVGAIIAENIVLVKFLGLCPIIGSKSTLRLGGSVLAVMTLSTAANALLNTFVLSPLGLGYLETVAFVLVILIISELARLVLPGDGPCASLTFLNCAILGVSLIAVQSGAGVFESILYAFFSGLGFFVVLLLFSSVSERLRMSDIPKPFEGLPITLLTAALISMAFMGFSGLRIS